MDEALLTIPKQDIRKLLGAASGDAALLYLYLRAGFDPDQAREALQFSVHRYDCAMASLRQMGLTQEAPRYLEAGERPVYTEQDIAREKIEEQFGSSNMLALLVPPGTTKRRPP